MDAFQLRPLGGMWTRSIITIDVQQPLDRFTHGDPASKQAMQADIQRAEEIALSQFNRLVYDEVQRGTLRPGARRMKRFARYVQPTLTRRDNRMFALMLEHDPT